MSITTQLSPNGFKTALDEVFFPAFNAPAIPGYADATSSVVFKQMTSNKSAEQWEEAKGGGYWTANAENAEPSVSNPLLKYNNSATHTTWEQGLPVSKSAFDDDQHGYVAMEVAAMARAGRTTRDKEAMSIFRGGFTTTYGDSQYLFDTDHPVDGGTMSNKGTGALTDDNLETGIVALAEQKSRDGMIMGNVASWLLVPPALYAEAVRLCDARAVERPGTANREINVWSVKYGIFVYQSPFLGTAAGGSDTAWYLGSENHGICRFNREDINTKVLSPEQQKANSYFYAGRFRQSVSSVHPFGVYGSTGAG